MSCKHIHFPDGSSAIICGMRRAKHFCACGRAGELQCDWKVKTKRSGTCDRYICKSCALHVGPDKHLCPEHQQAYAEWRKKHPGAVLPPDYAQMSLLES